MKNLFPTEYYQCTISSGKFIALFDPGVHSLYCKVAGITMDIRNTCRNEKICN